MPVIFIEGQSHAVAEGQNMLQASLALGYRLPYFCWHPAVGSIGACRQCAVKLFKDEHDTRGRIVMACMTPAAEGTRIAIEDPEAIAFRAAVLEWLMTNHPHDCPVCDEGGECHLQDMTVMTGHVYRRHRFPKRTFRNQELGPLVHHEMNRCIQCYRCVRFYRDYAGGTDLVPLGVRNQVYFGRSHAGTLESPFAGNLIEVCPTGVFTDKRLRGHYTRKWDLQTAPTICVHCGVGCNTIAGERYGELRRVLNRYHGAVNGYFLCDRGRFGYEFVNGPARVRAAGSVGEPVTTAEARARFAEIAQGNRGAGTGAGAGAGAAAAPRDRGPGRPIGIGSPRASLEANFALQMLVGRDHFYNGMGAGEAAVVATALRILRSGEVRTPSLREIEEADAVLVLGEDVTNSAPRLGLAVRQAVRGRAAQAAAQTRLRVAPWDAGCVQIVAENAGRPLHVIHPHATALDAIASVSERAAPETIARIAFEIAHRCDPRLPAPRDLDPESGAIAKLAAEVLQWARRPLIVAGTSLGSAALLRAAATIAIALRREREATALALVVPECNSLGVALLEERGLDGAARAIEAAAGTATVIVLENDLFRRLDDASARALLGRAARVVAIDHIETATTRAAQLVLPSASFAECGATLVSGEGRAQVSHAAYPPPRGILPAWRWLTEAAAGETAAWTLAQLRAALVQAHPDWAPRAWPAATLHPEAGLTGAIAQGAPGRAIEGLGLKVPRLTHRATGRTAMQADIEVSEPRPPADGESPFAFSMEGFPARPPADSIARYWAPGWNSVQALTRFQEEIGGPLRGGDPGARLFEPAAGRGGEGARADRSEPDSACPPPFTRRAQAWRVVEIAHVFGSEELSARAPGIAFLAPQPYVAIGAADAKRLALAGGARVEVEAVDGEARVEARQLPVLIRPELPQGVAGLPLGLPALAGMGRPEWVSVRPMDARAPGGGT
jgi:NADH-quinone oxidoreductase subunit G